MNVCCKELPLMPKEPDPTDCCGNGCSICVYDIYENDMKRWKECCKLKNFSSNEYAVNSVLCLLPDEYLDFELISRETCSNNTYIFSFNVPDGKYTGLNIGDHVLIRQYTGDGKFIARPYTPISNVNENEQLKFLIKIYPGGKMSQYINKWSLGKQISIRGPFGGFDYAPNNYKKILMLAAGTGIAPMYQIIKTIVENEDDFTVVNLFYASHSFSCVYLRDDLLQLSSYWNFKLAHFLSSEDNLEKKKYSEVVFLKKIEKADIESKIASFGTQGLLILVCGTRSFEKDMKNACINVGVEETMIRRF